MSPDRIVRSALWISVPINALGVLVFMPIALGYPSPLLPIAAPRFFAAQIGFVIALFLVVYARQAVHPRLNRDLVAVGGYGKLGFFALTAAYAIVGDVPMSMAMNATPDLILGGVFLWWAHVAKRAPVPAQSTNALS